MIEKMEIEIVAELRKITDGEIISKVVNKGNGRELHGITIQNEGEDISAFAYMEDYIKEYECGIPALAMAKRIKNVLDEPFPGCMGIITIFTDYDAIKDKIIPCLTKKAGNEKFLANTVYVDFLDLAVTFRIVFPMESGNGSILMKKEHLIIWKKTADDIFNEVKQHMPIYCALSMSSILADMFSELMDNEGARELSEELNTESMSDIPEIVLTNKARFYGAAALLNAELLKNIASNLNGDFFIIPSSVHEVICFPYVENEKKLIDELVKSTNNEEVSLDEQLEDHVYIYRAESRTIEY